MITFTILFCFPSTHSFENTSKIMCIFIFTLLIAKLTYINYSPHCFNLIHVGDHFIFSHKAFLICFIGAHYRVVHTLHLDLLKQTLSGLLYQKTKMQYISQSKSLRKAREKLSNCAQSTGATLSDGEEQSGNLAGRRKSKAELKAGAHLCTEKLIILIKENIT